MTATGSQHNSRAYRIAIASIAVAFAGMALKYVAYLMTGSVALYSDALESIVNVVTAAVAFIAVNVSARPPDDAHPFGHHKAEFLSAVLSGTMITIAAMLIFRAAYDAFMDPRPLTQPVGGLAVNALAAVLNGAWSWQLVRTGRQFRSPALVADGWHLFTDVMTSVGVLAGLILATFTGWYILDPLLAAVVAANILWAGYKITLKSVSGLLDEAASADIEARIKAAIKASGSGAIEAHDIRTRHAGQVTFIEFHLVVDGDMTVRELHAICDRIEETMRRDVEGAQVVIHVEPEHKSKDGALVI